MPSRIHNFGVFCQKAGYYLRASRKLSTSDSIALRIRLARECLQSFGIEFVPPDEAIVNTQPQCIYVANHASLLDAVLICSTFGENLRILAKDTLFKMPWIGPILKKERHIRVHRSKGKSACQNAIKEAISGAIGEGASVLIFPEGTRTPDGKLGLFKHGAFYNAIQNHVPIVPLVIRGAYEAMPKTTLKIRPGKCSIDILPPVQIPDESVGDEKKRAEMLCEQVRNLLLNALEQK